jgi:hypothetical protein
MSMRVHHLILLAGLLIGLVLFCGCTSTTSVTPPATTMAATPAPTTIPPGSVANLSAAMAFGPADLPQGYVILFQGPTIPPDQLPPGENPGYLGGYAVTAERTVPGVTSDTVDQTILLFNTSGKPLSLQKLFNQSYPELSNFSIAALPDPKIGDASIGYRYTMPAAISPPNTTIYGNVIIFRKGEVYEMVTLSNARGGTLNETLAVDLARRAANKIP